MNNKIIKNCIESLNKYNFIRAADILSYIIGYLESIEDYKDFVEILEKVYELL